MIEDARTRQWRHRVAASVVALAVPGIVAIVLAVDGGGGSKAGHGGATPGGAPVSGKGRKASSPAADQPAVLPSVGQMGLLAPGVGWAANGVSFNITRNSGRSWTDVHVPGLRGDIVVNLWAAASPSPREVVLGSYAGKVYGSCTHRTGPANPIELPIGKMAVSTNAGRTWRGMTLPGCVLTSSLSFVNTKVGFAVMMSGPSNPLRPALYVTTDGARTWRRIGPMPFNGPIDFASSDDGWGIAAGSNAGGRGALYHTIDGGRTWHSSSICRPTPIDGTTVACDVPHFFSDREGVVPAVLVNHTTGRSSLIVYSTVDAGQTWARHALPSDTQLHAYVAQAQPIPFSAPTASDFFTLIAGQLVATHDGGRHWFTFTQPSLSGFGSLDFASSTYGWVIAANAFDYTTDGGKSWNPLAKQ